jgi:hypothetical protein
MRANPRSDRQKQSPLNTEKHSRRRVAEQTGSCFERGNTKAQPGIATAQLGATCALDKRRLVSRFRRFGDDYEHAGSRQVIKAIDGRLATLAGQPSHTMDPNVSLIENTAQARTTRRSLAAACRGRWRRAPIRSDQKFLLVTRHGECPSFAPRLFWRLRSLDRVEEAQPLCRPTVMKAG